MNFQEAIEIILAGSSKPMTSAEVADSINERKLYLEWKGKPVDSGLVYGRAKQHTDTFIINSGFIRLVSDKSGINDILRRFRNILVHSYLPKSEIVIPFLVFWGRLTATNNELGYKYFGGYSLHEFMNQNSSSKYLIQVIKTFQENLRAEPNIRLSNFIADLDFLPKDEFSFEGKLDNTFLKGYEFIIDTILNSGILEDRISDSEFSFFYKELIKVLSLQTSFRGQSTTNDVVSQIISSILQDHHFDSIYDPFAGTAGLISAIVSDKDTTIKLKEINNDVALIGWMNLTLNGFRNFNFSVENSFTNQDHETFNLIVSEPPFNIITDDDMHNNHDFNFKVGKARDFSTNSVQMILSKLDSYGKAIIVIPDSFLTSDGVRAKFRKNLISNDLIQAIISLPSDIYKPFASLKTSILILAKNKLGSSYGKVLFQDFSSKNINLNSLVNINYDFDSLPSNTVVVPNSELMKNRGYSLDVKRFTNFLKFGSEFSSIGNLLSKSKSGSYRNDRIAFRKEFEIERNSVPFVTIKDLSDSASDNTLKIENVERCIILQNGLLGENIINHEAILVAKIGNKLKPTYFDGTSAIVISSNVLALFPDTSKVLSEYLISQLNEDYVLEQLEQIRVGAAQPYWRIEDFLNVKIKVEDISQQEKILGLYYKDKLGKKEVSYIDEIKKNEELEIKLLASLQHELRGQVLQPLVQEIDNIKFFFTQKIEEETFFSWDNKISKAPHSRSVKDVFNHLDDVVVTANKLFDNMQSIIELDKSKLKKTKVNLLSYIKSEVEKCSEELKSFHITYSFDFKEKSNIQVEIDTDKFSNVINNFIRNSIQHGFDENTNERHLVFNVSKGDTTSEVVIDMLDNGKGFSNDFSFKDYITFGIKSNSKGSGIGGYLLYRTIEIHDGVIECVEKGKLISIPSQKNYPFIDKHEKSENTKIGIKSGVHFRIILPTKTN